MTVSLKYYEYNSLGSDSALLRTFIKDNGLYESMKDCITCKINIKIIFGKHLLVHRF